jgi:hypothetical protein
MEGQSEFAKTEMTCFSFYEHGLFRVAVFWSENFETPAKWCGQNCLLPEQ